MKNRMSCNSQQSLPSKTPGAQASEEGVSNKYQQMHGSSKAQDMPVTDEFLNLTKVRMLI